MLLFLDPGSVLLGRDTDKKKSLVALIIPDLQPFIGRKYAPVICT
jgi:hypothetical protein